jgi:hypothetical protein
MLLLCSSASCSDQSDCSFGSSEDLDVGESTSVDIPSEPEAAEVMLDVDGRRWWSVDEPPPGGPAIATRTSRNRVVVTIGEDKFVFEPEACL